MSGCSRWNFADGLPETSNCYCHPGIAGGSPAYARYQDWRSLPTPLCPLIPAEGKEHQFKTVADAVKDMEIGQGPRRRPQGPMDAQLRPSPKRAGPLMFLDERGIVHLTRAHTTEV